jgi:hypothetical protein
MAAGKRDVQINVRMSADDFQELKQASDKLWPGAPITNSSIVLGLAKLGAASVLKAKKTKPRG